MPLPHAASAMLGDADLPPLADEPHIMRMPADIPVTTVDDLLDLPDDGLRHELLDGTHVVTPAPRPLHQLMLGLLTFEIQRALAPHRDLILLTGPADILLGPRTLVQPDFFIVRRPDKPLEAWADVSVPLLAGEILSPTTAARDRGAKRDLYLRAGVHEYWIVDLDAKLVERWRPGDDRAEIVRERLAWTIEGASGEVDLPGLFERLSR